MVTNSGIILLKRSVKLMGRYLPAGTGIFSLFKSVLKNRKLVIELARRDLAHQHTGQLGGWLWLVVHPLILFTVYAVLFTFIFQVRVAGQGPNDYLVYLFSGLAPWLLTQDILLKSSSSLISSGQIIKKVMLSPELLLTKSVLASVVVQSILLTVSIVFIVVSRQNIPVTFLLLPLLFLLHAMLLWGLALVLSISTPYFRDLPELLRIFVTINIYLMPVTYVPSMVPGALRYVLNLNPFSHLIWCYQDLLYFNSIAHPISWIVLTVFSLISLVMGSHIFVSLRRYLASIL